MKIIERKIESTITKTKYSCFDSHSCCNSQASVNASGCITIRNYDADGVTNDEILLLSSEESQAIFRLFRFFKDNDLPF